MAHKVISMSLYTGQTGMSNKRHDTYYGGAALNANMLWPGWELHIHHDDTIPHNLITYLKSCERVKLIEMPRNIDLAGMFWRHEAIGKHDFVAVRDIDAVLLKEDWRISEEWIKSGKKCLRMHFWNNCPMPIVGGIFNWRGGGYPKIPDYSKGMKWQADENFLRDDVWPLVKNDNMYKVLHHQHPYTPFYTPIEPRQHGLTKRSDYDHDK